MPIPFDNIHRARHSVIKKDLEERGIQSTGDLETDRRLLKRSQITLIGGGKTYSWEELETIANPCALITLLENGRLFATMTVATIKEHYGQNDRRVHQRKAAPSQVS